MNLDRNILYMHLIQEWKDPEEPGLYAIPYTFNDEINTRNIWNEEQQLVLEARLTKALNARGYILVGIAFAIQKAIVKKFEDNK